MDFHSDLAQERDDLAYYKRENDPCKEEEALSKLYLLEQRILETCPNFMGYPCNSAFDLDSFFSWWQKSPLSQMPLNDVGNPYDESSYSLNARHFEREALRIFSSFYKLKEEEAWGYTTTGGTLGNEQGLYMGRERLKSHGKPILYVSSESHYSIRSLAKVLDLECVVVKSDWRGEMDYKDLEKKLNHSRPALFSVSLGTTFKGGIDNIDKIEYICKKARLPAVHYHADAALFGGILPFHPAKDAPRIDFEHQPYDSIAVSMHKFFGSPIPLGVFLTRSRYIDSLSPEYIEYIRTKNITIPCSRSSLSTLIFWWTMKTNSISDFAKEVAMIIENAQYLHHSLQSINHPSDLNDYSNTVYFKKPSDKLCQKWSLATVNCPDLGPLAHVVVMQHVGRNLIDAFIDDLCKERAL